MDPKHVNSANEADRNERMNILTLLKNVGPGIIAALSLYAAGDLTLMSIMGAQWGYHGLWLVVVALGGLLAFFTVTARYHLATRESITWALARPMGGKWITWFVAIGFLVAGFSYNSYLIKGMGIAWNYMIPFLPSKAWSVIWVAISVLFVWRWKGMYERLEFFFKVCLAILSVTILYLFIAVHPPILSILSSLIPGPLPGGTVADTWSLALAIMGATTTSVVIFGYAYTIDEKGWNSMKFNRQMKVDAVFSCALTFLFNTMFYAVAVETFHMPGKKVKTLYDVADVLGVNLGPTGYYIFYIALFAALITSVIGYGFWAGLMTSDARSPVLGRKIDTNDKWYSFFLYFTMIAPVVWTFIDIGFVELMKFTLIMLNYFFIIPLFAVILLTNFKRFAKDPEKFSLYRAGWFENIFLGLTFICIVYFCYQTIVKLF